MVLEKIAHLSPHSFGFSGWGLSWNLPLVWSGENVMVPARFCLHRWRSCGNDCSDRAVWLMPVNNISQLASSKPVVLRSASCICRIASCDVSAH